MPSAERRLCGETQSRVLPHEFGAYAVYNLPTFQELNPLRKLFSWENLMALALCLVVILLVIVTTDSAPQWIYQGF